MYDKNQYGFLPNSSTQCAIISLLHHLQHANNIHRCYERYIISLDISKAFDSVNHDKLLSILNANIAQSCFINLIKSYLCNRTQSTKIGSLIGSRLTVSSGVPQGSVLGPILFNIYINSLGPSNPSVKYIKYADDLNLILTAKPDDNIDELIGDELQYIKNWCADNFMVLNNSKTKIIRIDTNRSRLTTSIVAGMYSTYYADSFCFLGYNIRNDLKWSDHIDLAIKKMSSRLHILRIAKPIMSKKHLIVIYNGFIQSIYDYCFPIYFNFTENEIKRLSSIRKRAHNIICGSTCSENCLPNTEERWK